MNIFHKVTLRYLKENRTRTLVTIVGMILSAAMFTAVTTSISSLRNYLVNSTIYTEGNWYGAAYGLSDTQREKLSSDSRTKKAIAMELFGFADLKDSKNDAKPYLCVFGIEEDFTDMMPVHLLEGRLPENGSEILLPEHLSYNGGIDWQVGDTLSLDLGTRVNNLGDTLTNQDSFNDGEQDTLQNGDVVSALTERLVSKKNYHYTVVGIYERPNYEAYQAPGYTALTIGEHSSEHTYSLYLRTAPGRRTGANIQQMFMEYEDIAWELNYDLLRIYGYSGESSYNRVMNNLGALLILIIMFGSISLIYNAFSISVSERTKQFGLLASIGATRRQLTGSVIFESLFLSVIGIPLGILSGLAGIGITFYFVQDMMADVLGVAFNGSYQMMRLSMIFGPAKNVALRLHPSFGALAIAIAVSLLTVIISAYIPARRAMKKPAIDAIRQSNDISIRSKKVKTSRLTQKLFGFEGMLATKNYKRNRRKYRATVISLFLSVVLFISASSFCAYLSLSAGTVLNDNDYDLAYMLHPDQDETPDSLLAELSGTAEVTDSTYAARLYFSCPVETARLNLKLRDYMRKEVEEREETYEEYEETDMDIMLLFLADKDFRAYLQKLNLPEDEYFNKKAPKAVAADSLRLYSGSLKKYFSFPAFKDDSLNEINVYLTRERENYDYGGSYRREDGVPVCDFYHQAADDEIVTFTREESCFPLPLEIGATVQQAPDFFADENETIRLFYPYSMLDYVFSGLEEDISYYQINEMPLSENTNVDLFFKCQDHKTTNSSAYMTKLLMKKGFSTSNLVDYAASVESSRAMVTVINIFSYGFIILISLIAAANVFNTISTNISLRRREFAMLKSIGMTPKAFSKMMDFECLLYGFKGLLYGLPVSFVMTWLIYTAIGQGLEIAFFIPWYSIAIAVGSVFLVVFATMLYSMRKIRNENTIDTLKNENL